jgi:Tfp pilus assembly protein PilP
MTRIVLTISVAAALALALPVAARQQPPEQKPADVKPAPPPVGFSYNAEGRRDPFISLSGRGTDQRALINRPAGVAGLLINEIQVKGVVRAAGGFYALVQGADNKIHTVRTGDRLLDGTVKAITAEAVVFSQDVNDPLSLQKQREIRKSLRSGEESRG